MKSCKDKQSLTDHSLRKITWIKVCIFLFGAIIVWRMFFIQVLSYARYNAMASDQYGFFQSLLPERGEIFFQSYAKNHESFPVAINREYFQVYAKPYLIRDATQTLAILLEIFPELSESSKEIQEKLEKEDDPYEPILHKVSEEKITALKNASVEGIEWVSEMFRYYPENNIGSQVLGFVNFDGTKQIGQYGIEEFFEEELSGKNGFLVSERDAFGGLISIADQSYKQAEDGADIYLTLDHTLEYTVCSMLNESATKHGATGGSIIIMEPKTGKIIAMCSFPDFNPNEYQDVNNMSVFNNPAIFAAYEPGSVFKPITLAAALDQGSITPESTYQDPGERRIDSFTIRNALNKTYGVQTMTQVLQNSINTGAIYAAETIGREKFADYVRSFGFGQTTGIELIGETGGDITPLDNSRLIYMATASFGQGITVTPLQMVAAYAAIANGGKLMKPYIVEKIQLANGETLMASPKELRQVISSRAAALLSGMLVSVVEEGHATRAHVPGYYIAGKTGTAQVPDPEKGGYSDKTIHTFVGFGPVSDPAFAIIIRFDDPKDVRFADSSSAPLFGQIANFLLHYLEIEPEYSDV